MQLEGEGEGDGTWQTPEQLEDVNPGVDPNRPPGQEVHSPALARLYLPAAHCTCELDVAPELHMYPAVHAPVQVAVVSPDVAP